MIYKMKTLNDLLELMTLKSKLKSFQSFDPRDFGADYDIIPIPKDNTKEATYWNI